MRTNKAEYKGRYTRGVLLPEHAPGSPSRVSPTISREIFIFGKQVKYLDASFRGILIEQIFKCSLVFTDVFFAERELIWQMQNIDQSDYPMFSSIIPLELLT